MNEIFASDYYTIQDAIFLILNTKKPHGYPIRTVRQFCLVLDGTAFARLCRVVTSILYSKYCTLSSLFDTHHLCPPFFWNLFGEIPWSFLNWEEK